MNDWAMRGMRSGDFHPEGHDARQGQPQDLDPISGAAPGRERTWPLPRRAKQASRPAPTPPPSHLILKTALRREQEVPGVGTGSSGFGAGRPRADMAATSTSYNLMNVSFLSRKRERKPFSELLRRSDEIMRVRDVVGSTLLGTKYKCFVDEDSCKF